MTATVARVRLECTLCPWVDPLASADTEDVIVVPVVCPACQARALEDRRVAERRKLKRVGPWTVRGDRRRAKKDRRKPR